MRPWQAADLCVSLSWKGGFWKDFVAQLPLMPPNITILYHCIEQNETFLMKSYTLAFSLATMVQSNKDHSR